MQSVVSGIKSVLNKSEIAPEGDMVTQNRQVKKITIKGISVFAFYANYRARH